MPIHNGQGPQVRSRTRPSRAISASAFYSAQSTRTLTNTVYADPKGMDPRQTMKSSQKGVTRDTRCVSICGSYQVQGRRRETAVMTVTLDEFEQLWSIMWLRDMPLFPSRDESHYCEETTGLLMGQQKTALEYHVAKGYASLPQQG
ncbi:hypothetical protein ACOSP7_030938 [Xanthoceras sorbifolium]